MFRWLDVIEAHLRLCANVAGRSDLDSPDRGTL